MEKQIMDIVIPSRGRANSQPTLNQLVDAGLCVRLIVPYDEYEAYCHHSSMQCLVEALPPSVQGIANKRQWIMENVGGSDALIMLDDDLTFFKRREDDPHKLRDITSTELGDAFYRMEGKLLHGEGSGPIAHMGFAAREGANRCVDGYIDNTRIMRVLGYNRAILKKHSIRFDRLQVMEDFDVALQLLRLGYPNRILNNVAHNQKGSGAVGGCSVWRTPQVQAAAAQELAKLHPKYVKVVEKTTKGAWGGGTRTDVTIQWKRAYNGK